jgi:hypothetical protein
MTFLSRSKKAAVLGCGPAGIFAAHALIENGWDVTIFSKVARKSDMFGAQYLHNRIPGLTPINELPTKISYRLEGTPEGYRDKVYGAMPVKVSPETLTGSHLAWDIRAAYEAGYDRYDPRIAEQYVDAEWLNSGALDEFKVVISSVWLPLICGVGHEFHSASVWAMGDAPRRGQYVPIRPPADTVVCDGTRDTGWYRAANVHGHVTVEWPSGRKPPLPGVAEVTKPIYSTCDCYANKRWKFVKVGRYGTWSKGVLSHDAYTVGANL